MRIECTKLINSKQKIQLSNLINECKLFDNSTLTYPLEDEESIHFFAYDDYIVSALALCKISEDTYECIAFTKPSYRCMNYFKTLYEYALEYLDSIFIYDTLHIHFIYDNSNTDTLNCLSSIKAELMYHEFEMELNLTDFIKNLLSVDSEKKELFSSENSPLNILYKNEEYLLYFDDAFFYDYKIYKKFFSADNFDIEFLKKYREKPFAKFSLLNFNKNTVYFYSFYLEKALRGQKIGKFIFTFILKYLYDKNYTYVKLQVKSENLPAFKIYKNSGFKTGVKLSYYEKIYTY